MERPIEPFTPRQLRIPEAASTTLELGSGADVGNLGWLIQEQTGWGVSIPSGMLDDGITGGTYGPDGFADTLAAIADASGFEVSFNNSTGVITFD